MKYSEFLAARAQLSNAGGFEPDDIPAHLFDFQRELVHWAVRQGRGALFADCGLGKTPMELAWAEQVHRHTGRPVLLLTPLAVGFQIVAEAEKFGHDASLSRDGSIPAAITVTNYEQLHRFDPSRFGGVVCDESSAIKAFDGVTRAAVTEFMRLIQYRLLATATAAPNDWIELGTSSEALGGLGHMDMLSRFFTDKERKQSSRHARAMRWELSLKVGQEIHGTFRLKGPAEVPFWRWVASWARAMRRPSDYGFSDVGFDLPPLVERRHVFDALQPAEGTLFDVPAVGLNEEREEQRRTIDQRCEFAADRLAGAEHGIAWCHLNAESTRLAKLIPGAVELTGSEPSEVKESKLQAFSRGEIRVLVTKPKIGAWGLNWQHAHRMTYFPSHSYEQYYQAVRRMWRFGQTQPVEVDIITTTGGRRAMANLERKSEQADQMFTALVAHMREALAVVGPDYNQAMEMPPWAS